jgi:hypothetical protein
VPLIVAASSTVSQLTQRQDCVSAARYGKDHHSARHLIVTADVENRKKQIVLDVLLVQVDSVTKISILS